MLEVAIVFDLDGVLVDTLPSLEEAYQRFSTSAGIIPSQQEFAELNGPNLTGMIAHLTRKHALEEDMELLRTRYQGFIEDAYRNLVPMPGALETVRRLSEQHKLGIASSASGSCVTMVQERFGFPVDVLVSGDQVQAGKPRPDIYLEAKQQLLRHTGPLCRFVAIEDSLNGLNAAIAAHLDPLCFAPEGQVPGHKTVPVIRGMKDLPAWIEAYRNEYQVIEGASGGLRLACSARRTRLGPTRRRSEIEACWATAVNQRGCFNGEILCLFGAPEAPLTELAAFASDYKTLLADRTLSLFDPPMVPLAVSGLVRAPDGAILFGRRSKRVTEYAGCLELVPSGGLTPRSCKDGRIDSRGQVLAELREETGIMPSDVASCTPLVALIDRRKMVLDIGLEIRLKAKPRPQRSAEHDELVYVDAARLPQWLSDVGATFVPTSLLLIQALGGLCRR